jgi:hypothetical protein
MDAIVRGNGYVYLFERLPQLRRSRQRQWLRRVQLSPDRSVEFLVAAALQLPRKKNKTR